MSLGLLILVVGFAGCGSSEINATSGQVVNGPPQNEAIITLRLIADAPPAPAVAPRDQNEADGNVGLGALPHSVQPTEAFDSDNSQAFDDLIPPQGSTVIRLAPDSSTGLTLAAVPVNVPARKVFLQASPASFSMCSIQEEARTSDRVLGLIS